MAKYKDTPRYNVISMRISDSERKQLQQIASRHSLSVSGMMRKAMKEYSLNFEPMTSEKGFV